MDVGAWLRGLGLGQYEPAFRENDVDARVPAGPDRGRPQGDRRCLGRPPSAAAAGDRGAIRDFGTRAPAPAPAPAERRHLTVMFVDLVGSTVLSGQLDPEELGELIRAYQNLVAGEVTRFEGHVAKYMIAR